MNAHEIRKLTSEQIKDEITSSRRKIFDLRAQAVTEKVANVSQFPTLRHTIARLLTEQGARARAANPASAKKMIRGLSKEGREKLLPKVVNPSAYTKAKAGTGAGSKKSAAGATATKSKTKSASTKVKSPRKAEVKS
jgi:ribosomal protein L29